MSRSTSSGSSLAAQFKRLVGPRPAPISVEDDMYRRIGVVTSSIVAATCALATLSTVGAEPPPAQTITPAGSQAMRPGPAENFIGRVRVEALLTATREINVNAAYVTFDPGARSNWHSHPAGQRLVVISGVGLTQEWGKPLQEIRAGDVVICPPGVKHWHGASPESEMKHLAITGVIEGKTVDWLGKVTDKEYLGE
jgi:4-carboxymuconolactone decarboxylase